MATRNRLGILLLCLCTAALLAGLTACSKYDLRQSMREAHKTLDKLSERFKQQPPDNALPVAPMPVPPEKPAKPAGHAKASAPTAEAEPLPEPTQEDLVEYLRGKLLTLSPSDGFNDNVEVRFDAVHQHIDRDSTHQPLRSFLSALDTNNITWDTFDPSDDQNPRQELLRLTALR